MRNRDKQRQSRDMARELLRGSIIEDATAQFLAQVIQFAHETKIAPLQEENAALRRALMDAINRPKGVVPESAERFYNRKLIE